MKPEFEKLEVIKNNTNNRFELTVDNQIAFIDFKQEEATLKLIHTESPEELAGRGVATALIEKTLIYFKENNLVLVPLCPLVFAYLKRHPEWIDIVREDYKERLRN